MGPWAFGSYCGLKLKSAPRRPVKRLDIPVGNHRVTACHAMS